MEFWIDVEDASGNKLGDGPITTALFWERVRRLDRIGEVRFAVPAADARARALLGELVRVHAWGVDNGVLHDGGIGIVEKLGRATDTEGKVVLEVEGSDLLRELAWRRIFSLGIYQDTAVLPSTVKFYDGGVYSTLPEAFDGNPSTFTDSFLLQELDSFLYIGADQTFNIIDITFKVINTIAADGKWGFSDERPASLIPPNGGWREPDVEDGTVASGAPLGQDGTVEFTRPGDWFKRTLDGVEAYYVRLDPTTDLDFVSIFEITLTIREATTDDLALIFGYPKGDNLAPYENDPDPDAGWLWELDPTGYTSTELGTYFFFVDETVLSALGKVGERTAEHFLLGDGRKVLWLRGDMPSSGIVATSNVDPIAAESNPNICLITELTEEEDASSLFTRVVPYGGGNDTARITLSEVSAAAEADLPSDFVLDREANYIAYTPAETAYGRIVDVLERKEIKGEGSAARDQAASDELFYEALYHLQRHVEPYKSYRLSVTGLQGIVDVGSSIYVDYQRVVDGEIVWEVKGDLRVLEATDRWDENGFRTVGFLVTKPELDRYPETDADYVNKQLEQARVYTRHAQGVASRNVR
jgi:hypothetical protein